MDGDDGSLRAVASTIFSASLSLSGGILVALVSIMKPRNSLLPGTVTLVSLSLRRCDGRSCRLAVAVTAVFSGLIASGCQSVRIHEQPLHATLVTDSTEIGVNLRGNVYTANIGFTFTNNTAGPISRAGCGGPGWPALEKLVDGSWVAAYHPISLACLSLPHFYMDSGTVMRETLRFLAYKPGHNTLPELAVDSIDGIYRLQWSFSEGRQPDSQGARTVNAVSNQFRMRLMSAVTF